MERNQVPITFPLARARAARGVATPRGRDRPIPHSGLDGERRIIGSHARRDRDRAHERRNVAYMREITRRSG
jgi:hypothetical protein